MFKLKQPNLKTQFFFHKNKLKNLKKKKKNFNNIIFHIFDKILNLNL